MELTIGRKASGRMEIEDGTMAETLAWTTSKHCSLEQEVEPFLLGGGMGKVLEKGMDRMGP